MQRNQLGQSRTLAIHVSTINHRLSVTVKTYVIYCVINYSLICYKSLYSNLDVIMSNSNSTIHNKQLVNGVTFYGGYQGLFLFLLSVLG